MPAWPCAHLQCALLTPWFRIGILYVLALKYSSFFFVEKHTVEGQGNAIIFLHGKGRKLLLVLLASSGERAQAPLSCLSCFN